MSVQSIVAKYLSLPVAAALLTTLLIGVVPTAHARVAAQEALYPVGVEADIGDGWAVTLLGATARSSPASIGSSGTQVLLTTTWQVRNAGSQPRYFPTDRLRIVGDSDGSPRVTSCEAATNPLELSGRTPPGGSDTGSACWLLNARDVSKLTISVDPPSGEAGRPPVYFAANPTYSVETVARPPAPPAPASAPSVAAAPTPVPVEASPRAILPETSAAAEPPSVGCAPVYSAYANASGSYLSAACGAATGGSGAGPALATTRGAPAVVTGSITASSTAAPPRASPCQLYPSAAQPSTSSAQIYVPTASNQSSTVSVQGPASGMGC